jgi:hypothetical protein
LGCWLFIFLIGAPLSGDGRNPFSAEMFLAFSLIAIVTLSEFTFGEWPARLRFLWLRVGGNRRDGWQRMESALLQDLVILGTTAAVVAILVGLFSSIDNQNLLLYVAGSVVWAVLGAYLSFWMRAANRHKLVHMLISVAMIFLSFAAILYFWDSELPIRIFWVLPILMAFAVLFRALAKRRVLTIDWCAVRPTRLRRQNT